MKVDITVTNNQTLAAPGSFATAPSEVDIRVSLHQEVGQFPDTVYEGQIETLNFVFGGPQVQTVTFDIDPQTVTNGRLYYGYKITAPALIQGEDFDEADIYTEVEEGVDNVYLYPINFVSGPNVRVLDRDGSRNFWFPPTGIQPSDVITPTFFSEPPGGLAETVPGGHEYFPALWAGFQTPLQPFTNDIDTPLTPDPSLGHDRVTTFMTRAFDLSLILAEDTNEFWQKVSQYQNVRLNVRPIVEEALGNEYVPGTDEKAVRVIGAPNAAELHIHGTQFLNKDSFAVNLRMERPTVNGLTLNQINSFNDLTPGGTALPLLWWIVRFEFEIEVQNPTTQEWSVYNPRIAILDGTDFGSAGEPLRFTFATQVGSQEITNIPAIDQ